MASSALEAGATNHGRLAIEAVVILAAPIALLGSAASDIYLTVFAVAFLLWRGWRRLRDGRGGGDPLLREVDRTFGLASPWFKAALAFWLWMMLAAGVSPHADASLGDAAAWIRFPVFAAALATILGQDAVLRARLLQGAALGAAAMAAILVVERIQNPMQQRLYGPWNKPKPGWYMLGFGLPVTLWSLDMMLRRHGGAAQIALAGLAAALFPVAAIATGEIGVSASFLLGVACFVALTPSVAPRLVWPAAIVIVCVALIMIVNSRFAVHFTSDLVARLPWRESSDYYNGWAGALRVGLENWLIGVGPGGFKDACEAIGADALRISNCIAHPHQLYLQTFAETGLVGVALFATMVGLMLRSVLRVWPDRGRAGDAAIAIALVVTLFMPLATYSDAFGQHKNFFTWLGAGWALAAALGAARRSDRRAD